MNVLLVYLPFCTPASPPYSITQMRSFLDVNCEANVSVLDLNVMFHNLQFPTWKAYFRAGDFSDYEENVKEFRKKSSAIYSTNNKNVVQGEKPGFFDELLRGIRERKPDIVAFSIVYSSQAFWAKALLDELKDVTTVIGGPCVNDKLKADHHFINEIEFLEFLRGEKVDHESLKFDVIPDFSVYNLEDYFTPAAVIPIKTSTTCFYKQCTFCSHYANLPYKEYDLELIEKTIVKSGARYFFLIDDMIPKKRLVELGKIMKEYDVKWTCQLKPTKDLDEETMKQLFDCGLRMVIWGVESGCQRVLDLMKKGTVKEDVADVLAASHKVGVANVCYVMFGFPSETKQEFMETIEFLEENQEAVDLISPSVFGLQHGTPIYNDPDSFGIINVVEEERTVLEPKVSYSVASGLSNMEALTLKKKMKSRLNSINKYPATMNFFRGHMLWKVENNL